MIDSSRSICTFAPVGFGYGNQREIEMCFHFSFLFSYLMGVFFLNSDNCNVIEAGTYNCDNQVEIIGTNVPIFRVKIWYFMRINQI